MSDAVYEIKEGIVDAFEEMDMLHRRDAGVLLAEIDRLVGELRALRPRLLERDRHLPAIHEACHRLRAAERVAS